MRAGMVMKGLIRHMKRILCFCVVTLGTFHFTGQAGAQSFYESFPHEPGLLPGVGGWSGEEGAGSPTIMPGSLNYTGLAPSQGKRVRLPSTRSKVLDTTLTVEGLPSDLWFSFIMRIDKADQLGVNSDGSKNLFGFFRIGAANGTNGPGLYLKPGAPDSGTVELLGSKRANPQKVMTMGQIPLGKPALIVGHYNPTASPHSFSIWINPSADTLGIEQAPEPTSSTSDGADFPASYGAITLGGGVGGEIILMDEIRIGTSWAEVTPTK